MYNYSFNKFQSKSPGKTVCCTQISLTRGPCEDHGHHNVSYSCNDQWRNNTFSHSWCCHYVDKIKFTFSSLTPRFEVVYSTWAPPVESHSHVVLGRNPLSHLNLEKTASWHLTVWLSAILASFFFSCQSCSNKVLHYLVLCVCMHLHNNHLV